MEDIKNIRLICKQYIDEMFPGKGTFDANVGDFVKLKFTDSFGNEYMWVEVTKVDKENDKYEGRLDNDPIVVQCISYNDVVEFQKEDILQIV